MEISKEKILELRQNSTGEVLVEGDSAYDEARKIWNGMFDRRPAVISKCCTVEDVVLSVNFARDNNLLLAVKGGGHNSAGTSVCDDGMMIDLSSLNKINLDPVKKVVSVEGGSLLSAVDQVTSEYGLAVPSGIISHTGVGGLTTGGGMGWISRKHGMSVDKLLSAEVVTADGRVVNASEAENPDLFWAIRGGGGNFGIVTRFDFQTVEIGKEVYSGPIIKRIEDADDYLRFHREFVKDLPDEMTVWMVIRHAPPLPFLAEEHHGKLCVIVLFVWLGEQSEGEKMMQPVRDHGITLGDGSAMHPWTAWQSVFDGLVTHGARNYWKSHHLNGLSDSGIGTIVEFANRMPTNECEVFIPHMGGAPSRVAADATAYTHRYSPFIMNIHTRWQKAEDDARCMNWAREFHEATEPFSEGVYVNFISDTNEARARQAYTPEIWDRLVVVKRKWDPSNLFRMNLNINPS